MTVTEHIESGATLHDISHRFLGPMTQEQIDAKDCTIVVCMLNAPNGARQFNLGEMSGTGEEMVTLCQRLLGHKRAAVIVGGDADLWSFDDTWNPMVKKLIHICRAFGIPAIDGVHYFRGLDKSGDGWHFHKTEANCDGLRRMIEETRNMLYGVFPQGCFAKLVGIREPSEAQAAASSSGAGLERSSQRSTLPNPFVTTAPFEVATPSRLSMTSSPMQWPPLPQAGVRRAVPLATPGPLEVPSAFQAVKSQAAKKAERKVAFLEAPKSYREAGSPWWEMEPGSGVLPPQA